MKEVRKITWSSVPQCSPGRNDLLPHSEHSGRVQDSPSPCVLPSCTSDTPPAPGTRRSCVPPLCSCRTWEAPGTPTSCGPPACNVGTSGAPGTQQPCGPPSQTGVRVTTALSLSQINWLPGGSSYTCYPRLLPGDTPWQNDLPGTRMMGQNQYLLYQ